MEESRILITIRPAMLIHHVSPGFSEAIPLCNKTRIPMHPILVLIAFEFELEEVIYIASVALLNQR